MEDAREDEAAEKEARKAAKAARRAAQENVVMPATVTLGGHRAPLGPTGPLPMALSFWPAVDMNVPRAAPILGPTVVPDRVDVLQPAAQQ